MTKPILVGAVVYDPKVVVIWDIITAYFNAEGCPTDYVFYSNYERMVDALIAGDIHIAWNSPLAWLDARFRTQDKVRAIGMRDTDRDRISYIITRTDSDVNTLDDLAGKTVATGAKDSPQATLIPLNVLESAGLMPGRDVYVRRFDIMVGKHGDHIGGEKDALQSLLVGESDASMLLDFNWIAWTQNGTIDPTKVKILAETPRFDHCNFTVLESFPAEDEERWTKVLFSMDYNNPAHREMMDMEGLKEWLPGRTEGYASLEEAVQRQGFFKGEQ